jgi:hypothetical protein
MRARPNSRWLWWSAATLIACGGRSFELAPLGETGGAGGLAATGGAGLAVGGADAVGGSSGGESAGGSGGGGASGGGEGGAPIPPNPIDCLSCVAFQCPEALECVQNPVCGQGLLCGVTECLGGGTPDPICFLDCFGGDPDAALQAFETFSCITSTCGDACGGLIPGF